MDHAAMSGDRVTAGSGGGPASRLPGRASVIPATRGATLMVFVTNTVKSTAKRLVLALLPGLACFASLSPADAHARPRRPSAAQIKKMQEQAQYMQQEMMRYQWEVAAKEREVYLSFDENGNGRLEGGEQSRFKSYMHAVKQGKKPNPLDTIAPVGKGPKDWTPPATPTTAGKPALGGASGFK
jgi:hypothetical protein